MSNFELTGKTALVTGAGKGLGAACAAGLAREGMKVIAIARTQTDLDRLAGAFPDLIEPWTMDVTDDACIERISDLSSLDVLVNNAGTNQPEPMLSVKAETLDRLLDLNVRAAYLVAQAAARVMVASGGGSIVNMSSQMGHVGAANRTVYCTTKHALEGMTKAMAVELAADRIRVNAVAPTFIETPMTRPYFENEQFRAYVNDMIPMGHIGREADVVNAVLFLASDLSAMTTGHSLLVDGGWTAH